MFIVGCLIAFVAVCYLYAVVVKKLRKTDPVYGCELYKEQGCAHVDGMLCDFPKCSMLADYRQENNK